VFSQIAVGQPVATNKDNEVIKTSPSNPDFALDSNASEKRQDKVRQKSVKT